MSVVLQLLAAWIAVAILMALLWFWQRSRGNAGIVDVAWSFGTGLLGASFAATADGYAPRRLLIAAMIAIWSVRLGVHLLRRVRREAEDGRYAQLRRDWGASTQRNLFLFFQVQALWAVMFAAPMLAAARNPGAPLSWLDLLGVAVWVVALGGETVADRQLARFRANPENHGQVCRVGLWYYSRHPNYFFEWLHWWAYILLAIGSPLWWVPPAGVIVMFVFLTRVTGIPPTEAQALRSRGEAYREYQRTTSAFFPWPPSEDR
jgi:steroid 5-alpha reductase family enzyme